MSTTAFNKVTQTEPFNAVPVYGVIALAQGLVTIPGGGFGYLTQSTSYIIQATIPHVGVVSLVGQVPEIRLWGAMMQIDADALVGKAVQGIMVGDQVRWNFYEPPSIGGCSTGGGGATPTGDIPPRVREPLPEIFSPVTSGGGGGPSATPSPGEGDV